MAKILRSVRQIIFIILLVTSGPLLSKEKQMSDSTRITTVLFRISSSKSNNVSYLFGTHHAFGKSFFDSLRNTRKALKSTDVLIKENLNIPGHLAKDVINRRTIETKWPKYLSEEDLKYINSIFTSSPTDFKKMTPTELHTFLSRYYLERICLSKSVLDNYLSLDDYIGSVAKEINLELVGLETIEDQIKLINKDVQGMPRKVHRKRLSRLIERIKLKNENTCAEIDWYSNMSFDYKLDLPCQNTLMLTNRNEKWMLEIEKYLKSNSCFIAVGLSHLMYNCGLISKLRQMDYTITPIAIK